MRSFALLGSLLIACGACGDDGGTPSDATPVVDIDNGTCGAQLRFTGEYVDWDNDTTFCGIFDATFALRGGASDATAPNGRFDMCMDGSVAVAIADVTPSAGMSECSVPKSTYALAGIAIANPAVIRAGGFFSSKNFTAARQPTVGFTPDAAKGHVFVHIDGASRTITASGTHDEPQAIADAIWEPGNTGHDVMFPNVAPGTVTITATGGATIGAGEVPVEANKITYLSLKAL